MKYMLMMNVPGKTPYSISTWARKDVEAHLAFEARLERASKAFYIDGLSGGQGDCRL